MSRSGRHPSAFTLIELLIVIAIISLLAAILFPVFARACEKSRQTACLSNQRQLSLAILQYVQDNDETFPNGVNVNVSPVNSSSANQPWSSQSGRLWPAVGWDGQCFPYIKSAAVSHCLSDTTQAAPGNNVASYGYNFNFVLPLDYPEDDDDPPPAGILLSSLSAPAKTVLLFEVGGVTANLFLPREGADNGLSGVNFSAAGNGLDNRLYAQKDWTTSIANQYATGYLGGRPPFDPTATQFTDPVGRHNEGSNFLLGDGHAKWMRGAAVSSGLNALLETCTQDNAAGAPNCGSKFYAAGTASPTDPFQATFSTN